ncbi:MAG: DUF4386 domain-containing protein [Chloroflexi bacterium]|nr:DUF4386 domain-containing protein [Chloroflexota bacterium]
MNTNRKTAISVGVLFIIATVLGVLGNNLFKPILAAPDYLIKISANENQVIIGGLLVLLSAFACAGIAICLYPILRKYNEGLALGAVGLRLMEGMLYIVGVVGLLSILTLSQEYVKAGASNASLFQASGTSLLAVRDWAGKLSIIAFTVGALMYYYVFYQSKLIPRWLSGWGFLGAALSLAAVLLAISGQIIYFSTVFILLQLPIGVQEMVLAVWLIVKGFNSSAIASGSAKQI